MTDATNELEKAQKNQKETGLAETKTGAADNLREVAAQSVDEDVESSEPA